MGGRLPWHLGRRNLGYNGIGKSPYVVVAESSFTTGILGERVNIVMYDREISLLARFSKMTVRVPNFNYCKARRKTGQEQCPASDLFLVGQWARRSLVGENRVFWLRRPNKGPSTVGHETTIDGCITRRADSPGSCRRNWFNMWNSHVVEVLQRMTLFGTPVFLAST
jgi:hypothetical protein